MIRTLSLTRRQAGDIFNSYLLAYIAFSPIMGYLTDRFGARRVISFFGILLGAGALLTGTARNFWQGCLFFAIVGMGASAMWTPILTVVQRWFGAERRGMALGILSTGFGLGFAVMGKLYPVIVEQWNWQYCWYFLGAAGLFMVGINLLLLRSKPEDKGLQPWGARSGEGRSAEQRRETHKQKTRYSEILSTSRFWMIGISYCLVAASLYVVTTFMVDYARYSLGFSYETASSLATIHGLGQIVGVLTVLTISDRIGRRPTIFISNIIISASIAGILLSGTHEFWLFLSVGVFGAFFGVTFPIYGACAGDYFRRDIMGTVIGAWTPLYGLGAIGGTRLAGSLRDVTGSFVIPFLIMILTALLAAVFMLFVKKRSSLGST
jgi:sugar phosphate permease